MCLRAAFDPSVFLGDNGAVTCMMEPFFFSRQSSHTRSSSLGAYAKTHVDHVDRYNVHYSRSRAQHWPRDGKLVAHLDTDLCLIAHTRLCLFASYTIPRQTGFPS